MAKWKCEICGNEFDNFHAQGFDNKIYCPLCFFKKENQELQKQLEYLRSGEYYNQLRFEREMLEHIVEHGEVSKEDKAFIDMTHRNTELLEQQKEFIKFLEDEIKLYENDIQNFKKDYKVYFSLINDLRVSKVKIEEILQKYKEIIGDYK